MFLLRSNGSVKVKHKRTQDKYKDGKKIGISQIVVPIFFFFVCAILSNTISFRSINEKKSYSPPKLLKNSTRIVVITTNSTSSRMQIFNKTFKHLFPIHIFRATTPGTITKKIIYNRRWKKDDKNLILAVTHSHLAAIRSAAAKNWTNVLIMEDDANIRYRPLWPKGFDLNSSYMQHIQSNFDISLLYCTTTEKREGLEKHKKPYFTPLRRKIDWGAVAYFVKTQNVMEIFRQKFCTTSDCETFDISECKYPVSDWVIYDGQQVQVSVPNMLGHGEYESQIHKQTNNQIAQQRRYAKKCHRLTVSEWAHFNNQ